MIEIALPWRERAVLLLRTEDAHETIEAHFSDAELEEARGFTLEKRRREWQLARAAAKRLGLRLGVADDARRIGVLRPYLLVNGVPTTWYVSLSHSGRYAAAFCGVEPVGIDVQTVRTVSETATHLFLTDVEVEAMRTCSLPDRMLHFWCAKEAAWKRRSSEFATLKQLPLVLDRQLEHGLVFDAAETFRSDDVIVAVSR